MKNQYYKSKIENERVWKKQSQVSAIRKALVLYEEDIPKAT